jgi:hypothetical protein
MGHAPPLLVLVGRSEGAIGGASAGLCGPTRRRGAKRQLRRRAAHGEDRLRGSATRRAGGRRFLDRFVRNVVTVPVLSVCGVAEVCEHGCDAPVLVALGQQAQLHEDAVDVRFDGAESDEEA